MSKTQNKDIFQLVYL